MFQKTSDCWPVIYQRPSRSSFALCRFPSLQDLSLFELVSSHQHGGSSQSLPPSVSALGHDWKWWKEVAIFTQNSSVCFDEITMDNSEISPCPQWQDPVAALLPHGLAVLSKDGFLHRAFRQRNDEFSWTSVQCKHHRTAGTMVKKKGGFRKKC